MKRYSGIFPKICTLENMKEAHRNARKDKTFYKEVQMVDSNPEYYLGQIQQLLISGTYEVSEYTVSVLTDKGKERLLMKLPYFPDRIIQWAIMLQIEQIFNQVFTHFTCASLVNRGIHAATKLVDKYVKDEPGTNYCLKVDVNKFYPSINHEILKNLLRKKFKDRLLLELLDKIIDSIPGEQGVPIGSYLSQYLANFYLAYFDHWLKEEMGIEYVVRYMDDIVIFHHSKAFLHWLKRKMDEYLWEKLKLRIKDNWQIFPTGIRGVDFVGYRHFYGYKLLRKKTCKRFKRSLMKLLRKIKKGLQMSFKEWCSANSYKGWLFWCDSFRLSEKYLKPLEPYLAIYYQTKIKRKVAQAT